MKILQNESFKYTKDIRQLATSLDANERHWIWTLKTPQALNVADTFKVKIVVAERKDVHFALSFD